MLNMEELLRVSCIRGYRIQRHLWDVALGEVLVCEREPHNVEDCYAIAVKKAGMVNFQKWMIFDLSVSSKLGCFCVVV